MGLEGPRLVRLLAIMAAIVAAVSLILSIVAFLEFGGYRYTLFSILWFIALVYALRSFLAACGDAEC